jgi:hypothetical protein
MSAFDPKRTFAARGGSLDTRAYDCRVGPVPDIQRRVATQIQPFFANLTLALFWLGTYPSPLVSLIRLTALQVGNG